MSYAKIRAGISLIGEQQHVKHATKNQTRHNQNTGVFFSHDHINNSNNSNNSHTDYYMENVSILLHIIEKFINFTYLWVMMIEHESTLRNGTDIDAERENGTHQT